MKPNDSQLLVFEPKLRENFYPLTYTKLAASLLSGSGTLLEGIESKLSMKATNLLVPPYLEGYAREVFPELEVNRAVSSSCIVINSLVSHRYQLWKFIANALNTGSTKDFIYVDKSRDPVFGRLADPDRSIPGIRGSLKHSLPGRDDQIEMLPAEIADVALIHYPWELVRDNGQMIEEDYLVKGFSPSATKTGGIEIRGSKVAIAESAELETYVTLDSRKGPVIIDEGAEVQSFSHLTGPCYIGKNARVRSAKIREGTTIGANSKVAGEVEASIISEFSNKSHDGFLGHSIVGSWVNLGAMTTCSNLKNTYGKISVKLGRKSVDTGEIKVGVFLGDMSKTAIGSLLSSGKKIGVASQAFGLVSEDVPSFTMYGKGLGTRSTEVILESALSTQRRMMERRGLSMTEAMVSLIRSVYKMTKGERAFQRVSKARFKLP